MVSRTCLALFVVAVTWFAITAVHPVGPAWLLWATIPVSGPLAAVAFWSVSRDRALPAPTRRFWRHLSPIPVLVAAGQTAQAADVLAHPGARTSYTGSVMLCLDGLALLCLIFALARLPVGDSRPGAGARVALDAGTMALAAALFIWHFGTRPALRDGTASTVLTSLALAVLAILVVFALAKVMVSDYAAIDRHGLRILAAGVFVAALAPMLQPLLAGVQARLFMAQIYLPLVFWFAAEAAGSQARVPGSRTRPARRRPYSVLPYVAVAAVDGLLLVAAWQGSDDMVAVAFTAVALTAVVAYRQTRALQDNRLLLERLDHAASHDGLTGLANRALCHRRLAEALSGPCPVHVALLDLDGFKEINDTYGHEAGDMLLTWVAGALAGAVGPGDTAARLGGDEFVLVLPGTTCAEASTVIGRVMAGLADPVTVAGRALRVRASIGVACGRHGDDQDDLLRAADSAMYAAKRVPGSAHLHAAAVAA
ncbi:GGDEF domain-containing protein [Actinoplanes flavus]|uniref:GGDEF domain-containing protein n=1 Tax=Actinoplanes flavus TaxID=2820290 RepID=A0ABS3UQW9_9ACTN|nr:GGDEF domain-containing protein [Actinoplanes flavus]MBO3741170.1 GGDEF domain-containing protein [Actinoplanes flavus]